ncbi:MAG: hypothetical protein U0235_21985 [Polyangiaceae bacterium]
MAKIFGIRGFTMPGPLSSMATRKRFSLTPAISTFDRREDAGLFASVERVVDGLLTVVRSAHGLSKPRRWRFLVKNSLTEISR